jgi:hypothetical protein
MYIDHRIGCVAEEIEDDLLELNPIAGDDREKGENKLTLFLPFCSCSVFGRRCSATANIADRYMVLNPVLV